MQLIDLKASELKRVRITPFWKFWAPFWELVEDSEIEFSTEKYFFKLKLKAGFKTDGRSGPLLLNYFLPKWDDFWYDWAIMFHDAGYNHAEGLGFDFYEHQEIFGEIIKRSDHRDQFRIMKYFTKKFSRTDWLNVSEFDKENQKFIEAVKIDWEGYEEI